MKRLIIQIPCLNEEKTLPATLQDLPRQLPGFDAVEYLVIDDGSTDKTVEVARACGAHHILSLGKCSGLARAFMAGIEHALALGADVIVNTDGDNQYCGADVAQLVEPILEGKADMVIGARPIKEIEYFSPLKKMLQAIGSAALRHVSGTKVADAPSGFRAYTRECALRLNVFSRFTYTMETLIQAGRQGARVVSVPIRVNGKLRESRLFKGMFSYVALSLATIVRIYVLYSPMRFFFWLGSPCVAIGFLVMLRWLYLYLDPVEPLRTHVPSLIFASIMFLMGVQLIALGIISDLIAKSRILLEETLYRERKRQSLKNYDRTDKDSRD